MSLLSVQNVSVDLPMAGLFRQRRLNILSGISLTLNPGETLGLVGESGSGKTTLARAILGLQKISSGTLTMGDKPMKISSDFRGIRRDAAMMFQDAVASLSPRMTVGQLIAEPFAIHRVLMPKGKVAGLLAQVGLPPDIAGRYPHELSGGQARRVGVARALALDPKLVIADEPTAGLDVSVQAEILNLMGDLKAKLNLSYLIISHNLALVRHVADQIAVMYLGRLVETGPTAQVFAASRHPYTASLLAADPKPDPRQRRADLAIKGEIPSILRRPLGCEFHTRCPLVQALCLTKVPQLTEKHPGHWARCHLT
jgi:peptide/nickel transport system ATP-binding protein